ncbi:hypothetical protein Taro_050521 [Colocasia esculenta]|uniref:Uncharacterized protein n=1 Tax=Colocasia esculenta TaxID=4460 RepID=A0A843XEF1_COLES|nr:hypothetical protein [Colocasia esculenta]
MLKLRCKLFAVLGAKFENMNEVKVQKRREKEVKKLGKDSSLDGKISRGITSEEYQSSVGRSFVLQRLKTEGNAVESADETTEGNDDIISMTNSKAIPCNTRGEFHGSTNLPSVSDSSSRDLKPLLKLKFKNLYLENRSSWVSHGEEKNSVKGQRSKRKRPSPLMDKVGAKDATYTDSHQNMTEEVLDANWILQKLGKDAIGKRVEIHRQSDSSWHKGVVADVIDGTSSLLVRLDAGGTKTLELGKQGIRFISQKRRTKL